MVKSHYEIIFVGDFREPPFRTTTIADHVKSCVHAGYRTGLLQLASDQSGRPARIHSDVGAMIDSDRLTLLDPDRAHTAKLAIGTDPSCFAFKPRRLLRIDARVIMILVAQDLMAADEQELLNWRRIHQNARDVFSREVLWSPMSAAVREKLRALDPRPLIDDVDWHPCIDPAEWLTERTGFCSTRPVIGRSGPLCEQDWPDNPLEILSLYPDDPQFMVRVLNGGSYLRDRIGLLPRNWDVLTSDSVSEQDFLSSIDFFVYGHRAGACHPIDPCLMKAMASGAVAILPPSFEAVFGDGAVYCEPEEVKSTVKRLYSDRTRYLAFSEAGKRVVSRQYSSEALISRTHHLIGAPDQRTDSRTVDRLKEISAASRDKRRVMFITINGVGMGHLTRMLAIAERCPAPIEPVFVTMSQALKVLREQGYLAEFIPSRQYLDFDINRWNSFLGNELNEMLSFYDPAVVMFDGNVPYKGLVDVIKDNPDPWFIWSRRGMWRAENKDVVERERHFDIVLEPGDLAAADDHGITKRYQERTHHVRPVRLLDAQQMLTREQARRELGLDIDKPAVLIQLGAQNNFDYRGIQNASLAHMQERHDVQIAFGEWLISDQSADLPMSVLRMPGYPFARYFNAFDLAISAVGYNSFHELLFACVPTILIPNEATEQDNQLARALYADRHGLAVCIRAREIYRLTATIDKLLQPEERDHIKSRLARLDPGNGAAEAAALINELAYSRRVDRP